MPKLIPRPEDEYKNKLISQIECRFKMAGYSSIDQQRTICHLGESAFRARKKDPGKFTLDELIRMSKKFKIPVYELVMIKDF